MSEPPKPVRPPTIIDVAKRAGVSKSTVSNVIRRHKTISQDTIARVQTAIDALGFRPNILAQHLVQQRSNVIGVVIGDLANPFFSEMAKQVEYHASLHGFRVMFCDTQINERLELDGLRSLLDYRVAGLMFLAYSGDEESRAIVLEARVPAIFVGCSSDWGDVISADNEKGGYLATSHLIGLGHRRIAYVADPTIEDTADRARRTGYANAMKRAGLAKAVYHWRGSDGRTLREMPIEELLTGANRATGIFSANDLGAIALLDCADRLAIAVPKELSIVGFDDITLAKLQRINLTTMAQPKEVMARLGIETLATRIAAKVNPGLVYRTVDCELVIRGSTARPPRR